MKTTKIPSRVFSTPGKVILEATRGNKEFQLLKVKTTKWWVNSRNNTYSTESTTYEFKWKNSGAEKWGRTTIESEKGRNLTQTSAVKMFFQVLEYSENMTFRELDHYGDYKYPDTNK